MDEVARVPVAHLLIYFGLGLILLSHTRLTVLRSGWVWERLTVARGLPAGWIAATLLMLRTYILHYPDLQQALAVAQRQFKNTSSVLMAMRKATRLVNTFLDFRGLRHDHPGCRVLVTPPDLSGAQSPIDSYVSFHYNRFIDKPFSAGWGMPFTQMKAPTYIIEFIHVWLSASRP